MLQVDCLDSFTVCLLLFLFLPWLTILRKPHKHISSWSRERSGKTASYPLGIAGVDLGAGNDITDRFIIQETHPPLASVQTTISTSGFCGESAIDSPTFHRKGHSAVRLSQREPIQSRSQQFHRIYTRSLGHDAHRILKIPRQI